jgi:hypothetical protein
VHHSLYSTTLLGSRSSSSSSDTEAATNYCTLYLSKIRLDQDRKSPRQPPSILNIHPSHPSLSHARPTPFPDLKSTRSHHRRLCGKGAHSSDLFFFCSLRTRARIAVDLPAACVTVHVFVYFAFFNSAKVDPRSALWSWRAATIEIFGTLPPPKTPLLSTYRKPVAAQIWAVGSAD